MMVVLLGHSGGSGSGDSGGSGGGGGSDSSVTNSGSGGGDSSVTNSGGGESGATKTTIEFQHLETLHLGRTLVRRRRSVVMVKQEAVVMAHVWRWHKCCWLAALVLLHL